MAEADDFIAQEYRNESTFSDELKSGFGEYSKYVISDRALPDARDGMKPVHRRIMWAMHQMRLTHNANFKKCNAIYGEVTGKYHPHAGGTYEAIVRLAQPWSLRYPLVRGQGNFGSIDGLPPAAMRYTEAKLERISQELTRDISPNVVKFVPNWDGDESEPTVLPVGIPHLLLNGTKGIAVGMSSNIPPHHLGELIDGSIAIINNPQIKIDELTSIITGPDFPTGGIIVGGKGIDSLYRKGKGSLRVRSRLHLETPDEFKVSKPTLVVTEIPYFVSKSKIVEEIADLINEKKIRGVTNIKDVSANREIRIEIEVEEAYADSESIKTVQAQLFRRTSLETLFHARTLAFVYGRPRTLNLKQALSVFLDFREQVVKNIAEEELESVDARIHILEGLITASNHIDAIINLIRNSDNRGHAKDRLMASYTLSEKQADAVLAMTLGRLARVEQNELQDELQKRMDRKAELEEIINNRVRRLDLMKEQLLEIKKRYSDERRTSIVYSDDITGKTDRAFIHERTLLLSSVSTGQVRAIEFSNFNKQKRGGKGVKGINIDEDADLLDLVISSNKDELLIITKEGIVHKLPAYDIPEVQSRTAKGPKLSTVIESLSSEVVKIVPISADGFTEDKVLVTVTKNGMVKRTTLDAFSSIRRTGIKCLVLKEEDDYVADAFVTDGDSYIFMASKMGNAVVMDEEQARLVGRVSMGVRGMKLQKSLDDEVVSSFAIPKSDYETTSIFTVTEKGYGKRTELSEYRITNRGAKGVRNQKISSKTGHVVSSLPVPIDGEGVNLSLVNSNGILIRTGVKGIRVMGRSTMGVKVMRVKGNERVLLASHIVEEDDGDDQLDDTITESSVTEVEANNENITSPESSENETYDIEQDLNDDEDDF